MAESTFPVELPELKDLLKAGVQFGHETKRWNPRMKKYIFSTKNNIHIIDITQTVPLLKNAVKFLIEASRQGSVLFVGTKRQVSDVVQKEAIRSGSYFVTHRWAGGLLTNLQVIDESIKKLNQFEKAFDEGIQGRTKYEISKMKVEWSRLFRLFGGIKEMKKFPTAIVLLDSRYEIGSVVEAKKLGIPIVAVVDTNCDPSMIDYPVPGNDDAIRAVELFMKTFADAVLVGNGGNGVKHNLKDYSKIEVKIVKKSDEVPTEEKPTKIGKIRVASQPVVDPVDTKKDIKPKIRIKMAEEVKEIKKDEKKVVTHQVPKTTKDATIKKLEK